MEPMQEPLARLLVFTLTTGVVAAIGLLGFRSRPDNRGWRQIKVSAMHWTGVALGAPLTFMFAYVWLFVGSSRADAARQMAILFWLTIAFGLVTIIVALTMYSIRKQAVRWRGTSIAFIKGGRAETRSLQDILELRSTFWGSVNLLFRDGMTVRLDPHAKGTQELIERIADHLERDSCSPDVKS